MVKVHVNNEKMKQNGTLRPTIIKWLRARYSCEGW